MHHHIHQQYLKTLCEPWQSFLTQACQKTHSETVRLLITKIFRKQYFFLKAQILTSQYNAREDRIDIV